jgi:hypothetical protein
MNYSKKMLASALLAAALSCVAMSQPVRADLAWEHSGSIRMGQRPKELFTFKLYNHWTPQRHRVLLKYALKDTSALNRLAQSDQNFSASALMPTSMTGAPLMSSPLTASPWKRLAPVMMQQMPGSVKPYGGIGFVQRLDDDRVLAYDSQSNGYFEEGRTSLFQRLYFDPWKKLAPELSTGATPELTTEQRHRLLDEIRALSAPLRKRIERIYFRQLDGTRNFDGITARGYRLTQMNNIGGVRKNQAQWMTTTMEWWIADAGQDEAAVQQFREGARKIQEGRGWPTNSMWINEYFRMASTPRAPEWRAALRTFHPTDDSSTAALEVTPIYMAMTVTPPPLARAEIGSVRFDVQLTKRSTETIAENVFNAPGSYKKTELEPLLKETDKVVDGSYFNIFWDSFYEGMMGIPGF